MDNVARPTDRPRARAGLRPGFTTGRLAAGALGGLVGGVVFGVLMFTNVLLAGNIAGTGLLPRVTDLFGQLGGPVWTNTLVVWSAHMLLSIAFGIAFSVLVSPTAAKPAIAWGVVYGVALWLVAYVVALPMLLGEPITLGLATAVGLVGHILFGIALAVTYVGIFSTEVREMRESESPRVRAWARRQREN